MELGEHLRTTGGAVKGWLLATAYDAVAVGLLWLAGLLILGVPWALLWAFLGALLQFVPHLGPVLALLGPALVGLATGGWMRLLYVLILYAVIVVLDGLVIQPMLMKRQTRVPLWASVFVPLLMGLLFNFWGVLLAPVLLAVIFAYRERHRRRQLVRVP